MIQRPHDPQLRVDATGFVVLADDEGAIIPTELVYQPDDCLAVRLVLLGPDGLEVTWTFAWELLAQGLMSPAGEGDITVRPAQGPIDGVEVSLVAPTLARVWLPEDGVAQFVRKVRGRVCLDARGIAPALDRELATITDGT
ncbi:SsgA family sporulation/cell division regulator [Streptomyces hokutonensis]|uniref:SsgA family sporulation/cell division regulator n=1 Tax=Streptomyces hokutonensis TaxID=1306990 RepID=UPI0003820A92|nr:SsgA family sporulation/cell division regulator [Streptomyces hokutonensis]